MKELDAFQLFEQSDEGSEALFGEVEKLQEELTQDEIRNYIQTDQLFGLVKCGLSIPEVHFEKCLELSPLFGHRDITMDLLKQPMDERLKKFYPFRPDTDTNQAMASYANKYGNKNQMSGLSLFKKYL